jgi:hypothetical protein
LTFADAVEEISSATGREIRYVQLAPDAFTDALRAEAVPDGYVWLLDYLFATRARRSQPVRHRRRGAGTGAGAS